MAASLFVKKPGYLSRASPDFCRLTQPGGKDCKDCQQCAINREPKKRVTLQVTQQPANGKITNNSRDHKTKYHGGQKIKEKILYLEDLRTADAVFCINSLRGIRRVEIDFN